jgi:predicted TPR repeat methyltransferase
MSQDGAEAVDELLAAAYALDGPEANRTLYARWAETYESGFITDSRYIYHEQVAALFADRAKVESTGTIVDVGCGTGLAGLALRHRITVTLDGIDISPEMLGQAAGKRHDGIAVYRALVEADLTEPLAIPDNTYAGAISVGTFTHGHVGPAALAEVVRIVRPGGLAAIGINAAHFADVDFAPCLEQLVEARRIERLEFVDVPIYAAANMTDADNKARVAIFEVV